MKLSKNPSTSEKICRVGPKEVLPVKVKQVDAENGISQFFLFYMYWNDTPSISQSKQIAGGVLVTVGVRVGVCVIVGVGV